MSALRSILVLAVLLFAAPAWSATYYVDYASGDDTNNGTSDATPWKHCPGDSNATDNADITLSAGDTVNFKGGVRYLGQITVNQDGTSESRITFQGQPADWGTGAAIIEGSDTLSWTQCPNAETCGGNPNYANIYYATLPEGADHLLNLIDDTSPVYFATAPAIATPFFFNDITQGYTDATTATQTTIIDATNLTQTDDYWNGAWVIVHTSGNSERYGRVTDFVAATDTLTFTSLGKDPYQGGGTYKYTLFNSVKLITQANRYAIDTVNEKIYVWPTTDTSMLRAGTRAYCFYNAKDYITIDGFILNGTYDTVYGAGRAISGSTSTTLEGVIYKNLTVKNITNNGASAAVYLRCNGNATNYVQDNTFNYIHGRAINVWGPSNTVKDNDLDYVSGTGIYYAATTSGTAGGLIYGNTMDHMSGIHGNGISVYGQLISEVQYFATDFLVYNNIVLNMTNTYGPYALTLEEAYDYTVYNNVLDGKYGHWGLGNYDASMGYAHYYNNTITGTSYITWSGGDAKSRFTEIVWKGNILNDIDESEGVTERAYNFYTSNMDSLDTGEVENVSLPDVLTNYMDDDFTLKSGSAAIDAFPTASAPTGTFSTDILGVTRPIGSDWDIGAYEFGLIYNPLPNTDQPSGTTSVDLQLTTSVNSTCKYDTSDVAYGDMGNTFSTTGTTAHSQTIAVSDGNSYHYYCGCQDGDENLDYEEIQFSVLTGGGEPGGTGGAVGGKLGTGSAVQEAGKMGGSNFAGGAEMF